MKTTENYGFTIYEPNDVTAYLTASGWNGTMEKIDSSMKAIDTLAATNATDLATLEGQVSTDHDEINEITAELSDLTDQVVGNKSNIAGLSTRVLNLESEVNNIETELAAVAVVDYQGILSTGEKVIAIAIGDYTDSTIFDIYVSEFGVAPESVEVRPAAGGQPNLFVLTFADEATSDIKIDVSAREANVKTV